MLGSLEHEKDGHELEGQGKNMKEQKKIPEERDLKV